MKPHTESIVRVQSTIPIQCCLQYVKEEWQLATISSLQQFNLPFPAIL
jgi:hypothetical protein